MIEPIFLIAAAAAVEPEPAISLFSVILTAILSSTVVGAIVGGVFGYLNNKRNARIAERKNDLDAEAGLVGRYKEAAAEERAQKESAIQTVNNLLAIAERQVQSLKDTVDTLTDTINAMTTASNAQQQFIERLTEDRDRTQQALSSALLEIDRQKEELLRRQREILEMANPKKPELPEPTV